MSFGLYVLGYLIMIVGLIYEATILHVPQHWIVVAAVVLVGLGIGLSICLAQIEVSWGFGLIPLFMGIGYLMVWQLETRHQGRS